MLECGSVEGEVFHRGAVQALTPEEAQVTPRLAALVRRELIRSDRPQFAGEDGFRFRHLLIRDTAYDALPKATRAELHRRFADWLESTDRIWSSSTRSSATTSNRPPVTCAELGRPDPELARSGAAKPRRRRPAGAMAAATADGAVIASTRVDLRDRLDVNLVADLARALDRVRDSDARRRRGGAGRRGRRRRRPALARAMAAYGRLWTLKGTADEQERLALEALRLLEAAEDHEGLAELWFTLQTVSTTAAVDTRDESERPKRARGRARPGVPATRIACRQGARRRTPVTRGRSAADSRRARYRLVDIRARSAHFCSP